MLYKRLCKKKSDTKKHINNFHITFLSRVIKKIIYNMIWDLKAQMEWTSIIHNLMQHIHHITSSPRRDSNHSIYINEIMITCFLET